ncbi:MAG TPA: PIN domain-containing protein [Candidatus Solibacter sp.]|nr:PIN domain-containing protein [Candidatus Solibacter sp.]
MAGKFFVDTNILVYAYDRLAGMKHQRARDLTERLWKANAGALSTQVLQELCVSLQREVANPASLEKIREIVRTYVSWHIVVNTPESIMRALEIEERYKISFRDALIVQAAEKSGASILYSEDLATGQIFGSIQVVNPLL